MKKNKILPVLGLFTFATMISSVAPVNAYAVAPTNNAKIPGNSTEYAFYPDKSLQSITYYELRMRTKTEVFFQGTNLETKTAKDLVSVLYFDTDDYLNRITYYKDGLVDHAHYYRPKTNVRRRTSTDITMITKLSTVGTLHELAHFDNGTLLRIETYKEGTLFETRTDEDIINVLTF